MVDVVRIVLRIVPMIALVLSLELAAAQEFEGLKVAEQSHYFGSFSRDRGVRTHEFIFENTGSDPLLINRVKATCGCTVAEWTKEAIAPGEKGVVKVKFDPKKFSGYFSKRVSVYTNRSTSPVSLQISGRIMVNNKINDDFDFFLGDLKTNRDVVDFGDVEVGVDSVRQEIRFINIMRDTISIKTLTVPSKMNFQQSREVLPPGGNCSMKFTYYPSKEVESWGTQDTLIDVEIHRTVKVEKRKIPVRLALIDNFSQLDSLKLDEEAHIKWENDSALSLNTEGVVGKWCTQKVKFFNDGKKQLLIRRVEVNNDYIEVKSYSKKVKPGKFGTVTLKYIMPTDDKVKDAELVIWSNSPHDYRLGLMMNIK